MTSDDEELVPVFIPALGPLLIRAEDLEGEPLSHDEVIRLRDKAACIMMRIDHARKLDESRGYPDINPENCWFDWQHLRRELGRKPDLDPGPRLNQIRSADPEYQQTIRDAHATLDRFRAMLPPDGSLRLDAMVKTEIREGDNKAFMWLSHTRMSGTNFVAKFFEISALFTSYQVGDELEISQESLLDGWSTTMASCMAASRFAIIGQRFPKAIAKNTTTTLACANTHMQVAETARGCHPGFASFNVLAGGSGSFAERSAVKNERRRTVEGVFDFITSVPRRLPIRMVRA